MWMTSQHCVGFMGPAVTFTDFLKFDGLNNQYTRAIVCPITRPMRCCGARICRIDIPARPISETKMVTIVSFRWGLGSIPLTVGRSEFSNSANQRPSLSTAGAPVVTFH